METEIAKKKDVKEFEALLEESFKKLDEWDQKFLEYQDIIYHAKNYTVHHVIHSIPLYHSDQTT